MSPWLVNLCVLSLLCVGAAAQSASWPTERPPQPLPAREIKFPPYEIQTLPNGLQVVVVMHHEQPAVTMRLLVRAGTSSDPREKLGLAHLAASLLDQGTKTMSAEQMNDAVDFIGGAMGAGAGTDLTFCNMVVMKDSFDTGLKMLSEMARQPAFAPAEIERQRQQMLSGQKVSARGSRLHRQLGLRSAGLRLSSLRHAGERHAGDDRRADPRRSRGVSHALLHAEQRDPRDRRRRDRRGSVRVGEEECSATGQKRDLPTQTFIGPPDPTRRVVVVNKPDAVQTEVRVGHIGIPRTHPDYMAVNLAIRILGGEGSNRLHQVLRTERGLTYGAQANMDTLKESGDFEAETNTRSDATGEVLRLIVDEFWRLQRERVGDRELDGAKAYLTGSFPLTIETPESIAMQVVNALFYGLPLAELQNFRERVNAVTPDDIQRVAKALLRPDRLSVVLVGNSAAFASQLRGVGFGTFETVELADLDLTSANFKRTTDQGRGRPGGMGGTGWMGRTGRRGRAGGKGRLSASAAREPAIRQGRAGGNHQGDGAAGQGRRRQGRPREAARPEDDRREADAGQPPCRRRVDRARPPTTSSTRSHLRVESPGQVQAYDGTHVWMKDARGVHDAPDMYVREMAAGLRRDVVRCCLRPRRAALASRLLPDVKETEGQLSHALELSATDLNPIVLYIDPESSMIRKRVYAADAPGRPVVDEAFFDYRDVDGIQFAFRATQKVGPTVGGAPRDRGEDQRADRSRAVQTPGVLSPRLLLSCGEASGDLYAGALTRELLALDPALDIAGLGGPQFAAAGGRLVDDYREISVTGLTEWIPKLPRLLAARRRLVAAAQAERPDALVLIDFSGFNFRLAPAIKRLGVPVIYYISPQIWASRPGRLATIRAIADRVLVIFPFEAAIYEKRRRAGRVRRPSADRSGDAVSERATSFSAGSG